MIRKIILTFTIVFISGMVIHAEESPQQFQGFDLAGYGEGGKKTWDVKGDKADILGNVIKLTDIVANAYGDEQMNLTAKTGSIDKTTGKMHLQDDVVVTTKAGARLTTDSLDWEKDKDLVTTKDKVILTKEGMTTTGTGAIAHPGLNTAQINEDVTVKIKNDPQKSSMGMVTITCDGPLEVEYAKNKAVFNNNVVAVETDRKLLADKVEVFFDVTTKQIKELIATGHVQIIQGENITYAEKSVYNAVEQKVTLSGKPKLIMYTESENSNALFGSMK